MPYIQFQPSKTMIEVEEQVKILAAAIRSKVKIRFGCAACQCGTCAVRVFSEQPLTVALSSMDAHERGLLEKMGLATNGEIRLACKAKALSGEIRVDLDFQDDYSPEEALQNWLLQAKPSS